MEKSLPRKERELTVRDLYPTLTEDQLREAEENLDRYIELVLRIYERIRLESAPGAAQNRLTDTENGAGMKSERSKTQNNPFPNS